MTAFEALTYARDLAEAARTEQREHETVGNDARALICCISAHALDKFAFELDQKLCESAS